MRPALSEIRLDWATLRVIGRVWASFRGGDDHLLSGIGGILERDGFRMVGIRDVAPDLLMPEGCLTRAAPDHDCRWPISPGDATCCLRSSRFDIGQAAVVIDGHVVGVEDIEGTDGLLARVARLRAEGRIRAGRPWRAGQGAQERPGFAVRPAYHGTADRRGRRRGATWPALRSLPATPWSPIPRP